MAPRLSLVLALIALSLAAPVQARQPPPPVEPWSWAAPDPKTWWDDPRPVATEAADPLAGRRFARGEAPPAPATDPLLYRLWGLQPLQNQVLRSGEAVIEVWTRPALSVRQAVFRVVVRRDGKAFVEARAGLACCEPGIDRRVGFDAELAPDAAARFLALRDDPLWNAPRDVRVTEGGGSTDAVCLDGTAYDLTLAVPGQVRSVRRACDSAEVGQAADVLSAVFAAALGHEPRIDVLFVKGADFSSAKHEYEALIAGGGSLKATPR